MKKIWMFIFTVITVMTTGCASNHFERIDVFNADDYKNYIKEFSSDKAVTDPRDEKTTFDEIEMIWVGIYGDCVKSEKPYRMFYDEKNDMRLICGTLPENRLGGTAHAIVDDKTGKVLAIWHEK